MILCHRVYLPAKPTQLCCGGNFVVWKNFHSTGSSSNGKLCITNGFFMNILHHPIHHSITLSDGGGIIAGKLQLFSWKFYSKKTSDGQVPWKRLKLQLDCAFSAVQWYKYLGIEKSLGVNYPHMWEGIKEAILAKVAKIFNSDLTVRTNTWICIVAFIGYIQQGRVKSTVAYNILAAQEGQLLLKNGPANRNERDQVCGWCHSDKENAEHILSVCPYWRTNLMVKRHNHVARNLYYRLCVRYGFETRHYKQDIEVHRALGDIELYLNHQIVTTRKVRHNRPNMVVINHIKRTVKIIEIAVSWHDNIKMQELRKFAKYAPKDMNLNRNVLSKTQVPNHLMDTLRSLFDHLDEKYGSMAGFIKFSDVEYDFGLFAKQQQPRKAKNDRKLTATEWPLLPVNFLVCLQRITPANNMVTFERMSTALRLALAEQHNNQFTVAWTPIQPARPDAASGMVMTSGHYSDAKDDVTLKHDKMTPISSFTTCYASDSKIVHSQNQRNGFKQNNNGRCSSDIESSPSPGGSSSVSILTTTYKNGKIGSNGQQQNGHLRKNDSVCSISWDQSPTSSNSISFSKRPPAYNRAISLSRLNFDSSDMPSCDFKMISAPAPPPPPFAFQPPRKYNERLVDDGRPLTGYRSDSANGRVAPRSQHRDQGLDDYAVVLRQKSQSMNKLMQAKRHTVVDTSHASTLKSNRLLQEEKDLLSRSAQICNRLSIWFNDRLKSVETRKRLVEKSMPLDSAVNEERFNCLRMHITELNRRMAALMESSEKYVIIPGHGCNKRNNRKLSLTEGVLHGFPSHLNNESQRIMSQPVDDQYSLLKRQNASLSDEVADKTQRIAALEKERALLVKQLHFKTHLNAGIDHANYVNYSGDYNPVSNAKNGYEKRRGKENNFPKQEQPAFATLM
uniref:Reverse transcriptase zinc-binding domain-containing protein n=1 Tax=Romanomermis culicivorax TaxID=13658 RepID=A0A915JTJ3_ROMCU